MHQRKPVLALWLWLGAITLFLFLPLPSNPIARNWPALWRELENFSHPVAFAWLTHLVHVAVRARHPSPAPYPYLWVVVAGAAIAASTELLQICIGRDGSFEDAANDILGISFALLVHARAESKQKSSRLTLGLLATAACVLASTPLAITVAAYAYRSTQAPILWQSGSMLLDHFAHAQGDPYPGMAIDEPLPDWRGYQTLEVVVSNPQAWPLGLVVRVHDRRHNGEFADRYNGDFTVAAQSVSVLAIPLTTIRDAPVRRKMDLAEIQGVIVFSEPQANDAGFVLEAIRLKF